jgi:Amino acid permease
MADWWFGRSNTSDLARSAFDPKDGRWSMTSGSEDRAVTETAAAQVEGVPQWAVDAQSGAGDRHLVRSVGLIGAIGLSLALAAPSQAVNINPQAAVPFIGRAIPLAFLVSFVGVLFVAYAVTRLCQRIHGSGSLSTLVAQSLDHHAGAVTGWLICGAYILFVVVQAVTCAIFFGALLEGLGLVHSVANWVYFVIAFTLAVAGTVMASARIRRALGVLLSFEFGTLVLVIVVMAIVACTSPSSPLRSWASARPDPVFTRCRNPVRWSARWRSCLPPTGWPI